MRVDRDPAAAGPIVQGFTAGGFRVDGGIYPALLLTPTRADGWAPPALTALMADDLATLLEGRPEFILLGTGASLARAPVVLIAALDRLGVGLEVMDSRAAARAWGVLRGEGRAIAAALYPLA